MAVFSNSKNACPFEKALFIVDASYAADSHRFYSPMFKRLQWNNGICKKTGQPWIYFRDFGFRGPSITSLDRVYGDGLGNTLYIDAFSKINKEYDARRTPEIIAKEREFRRQYEVGREALKEQAKNKTGTYAPTRFDQACDRWGPLLEKIYYSLGALGLVWLLWKWITHR